MFWYNTDHSEMEVCLEMDGEGEGERERNGVKKKNVFLWGWAITWFEPK